MEVAAIKRLKIVGMEEIKLTLNCLQTNSLSFIVAKQTDSIPVFLQFYYINPILNQ